MLMNKIFAIIFFLLSTPAFAQFGALTVVPTHPSSGLQLSWTSGPGGTVTINRAIYTFDGSVAPTPIATTTGTTYLDTTAVANTIYVYSVSQGVMQTNTFLGVVSELTLPFNCPPMVPVDSSKLGVDRTEAFQSANGSTITFTIRAPDPVIAGAHIINVPPCGGAGGCSDYDNVNGALASVLSSGGTVQLAAGDYHFNNPSWVSGGFNIAVNGGSHDIILAGAPVASGADPLTHLYFNQTPATVGLISGLAITGNRILVRNLTVDWDFPNAVPGVVHNFNGSTQHFDIVDGPYYVPDPNNPPVVYILDAYHLANGTYNLSAGSRIGGVTPTFNTNFAMDGLYYYSLPGASNLPDGTEAVLIVKTRVTVLIGTDALNVSLENVRVYGGGGPGIIQGAHANGLRLSNVQIEKKPSSLLAPGEQSRYVSTFGDNDSNGSLGSVLIENSQFGLIEDDTYYMRGSTFRLQTLTSTSSFVMNASLLINHAQGPLDFFKFMDPATYRQIGSTMPLATWVRVGDMWTFSFDAIPELTPYIGLPAANLPWVGEPLWSAPNFIIRNSCSHDSHGRLAFLNYGGLVDNNVLANSFYGPLEGFNLTANPIASSTTFEDGPGPSNHIWRNNKIIGTDYGNTDLKTIWYPTVVSNGYIQTGQGAAAIVLDAVSSTGFYPAGFTNTNFEIYNNFISNTPGACILITSANQVGVVGNTCVDANQIPYTAGFNATYCGVHSQGVQPVGANQPWCLAKIAAQGAIMVTNSRNVDATSTLNLFLGTSGGLFVDTPTVTRDNIVGSRFH